MNKSQNFSKFLISLFFILVAISPEAFGDYSSTPITVEGYAVEIVGVSPSEKYFLVRKYGNVGYDYYIFDRSTGLSNKLDLELTDTPVAVDDLQSVYLTHANAAETPCSNNSLKISLQKLNSSGSVRSTLVEVDATKHIDNVRIFSEQLVYSIESGQYELVREFAGDEDECKFLPKSSSVYRVGLSDNSTTLLAGDGVFFGDEFQFMELSSKELVDFLPGLGTTDDVFSLRKVSGEISEIRFQEKLSFLLFLGEELENSLLFSASDSTGQMPKYFTLDLSTMKLTEVSYPSPNALLGSNGRIAGWPPFTKPSRTATESINVFSATRSKLESHLECFVPPEYEIDRVKYILRDGSLVLSVKDLVPGTVLLTPSSSKQKNFCFSAIVSFVGCGNQIKFENFKDGSFQRTTAAPFLRGCFLKVKTFNSQNKRKLPNVKFATSLFGENKKWRLRGATNQFGEAVIPLGGLVFDTENSNTDFATIRIGSSKAKQRLQYVHISE